MLRAFKAVALGLLFVSLGRGVCLAEDINTEAVARLQADLAYIASDDQEGRNVGSDGIARAGAFIANRYDELGLKTDSFEGTPYQKFSIPGSAELGPAEKNRLEFQSADATVELELGKAFTSLSVGSNGSFDAPVVFAGYGITAEEYGYDDFAEVDVAGKVVIVLRKEPQQRDEKSVFAGLGSSQYAYFSTKELNAAVHKVAALIMVNDGVTVETQGDSLIGVTGAGKALPGGQVPTFYCTRAAIDPVIKAGTGKSLDELEAAIDSDLKPRSMELKDVRATGEANVAKAEIPVQNVVGVLPGSGDLSGQYVVVGAHYDHVGMGGAGSLAPGTVAIHNGADDNGSGTVTLLEVARRLAANQSEHRRTVVFMAFTGEEKGLLGSKHYVRNPRWALEETVAMVNMDMVGRLRDNTLTVYGTGTALEFDDLMNRLNEESEFNLDKRTAGRGPSDHSSFYEAGIPAFHFFTGLHNDYHRPSDDVEKVNYEGMSRVADMVTGLVTELATTEKRPTYQEVSGYANVGRSRARSNRPARPRAVIGVQLDLNSDGVRIASVTGSGPAGKAGMQPGDKISALDGKEVENVQGLRDFMRSKKPGDEVKVEVLRDGEKIELVIKLGQG